MVHPTLKETGIIYVAAHAGKLTQTGMAELDKSQGVVTVEKRYSTWLTVLATLAPPIAAYMGWVKGDVETAA